MPFIIISQHFQNIWNPTNAKYLTLVHNYEFILSISLTIEFDGMISLMLRCITQIMLSIKELSQVILCTISTIFYWQTVYYFCHDLATHSNALSS